eukprot:TRINITY_DN851_c0_g6_i1.p1 TRINITY_DN851_c0_g6~~TRINITY_DN851_c0_g6_i1.p1  ORF type:complete len:279 (-),score=74.87 TRINITY_DN851_c0_g6_i1:63-899(-)
MSTAQLTTLLYTLKKIDNATADVRQKQKEEEAENGGDRFTQLKKRLAQEIRDIREAIKERDELYDQKGDDAIVAKKSHEIRKKLAEIVEETTELQKLYEKSEKKFKKKKATREQRAELENQKAVVELAWKHYKDCENQEGFRGGKKTAYFEDDSEDSLYDNDERNVISALPDIDDPKFQLLIENDKKIDEGLEVISKGVDRLKEIALDMNEELERQKIIIEGIELGTDAALQQLTNLNKQLKETLGKLRSGRNFCCDCICFLVIIGIGIGIYVLVTKL